MLQLVQAQQAGFQAVLIPEVTTGGVVHLMVPVANLVAVALLDILAMEALEAPALAVAVAAAEEEEEEAVIVILADLVAAAV